MRWFALVGALVILSAGCIGIGNPDDPVGFDADAGVGEQHDDRDSDEYKDWLGVWAGDTRHRGEGDIRPQQTNFYVIGFYEHGVCKRNSQAVASTVVDYEALSMSDDYAALFAAGNETVNNAELPITITFSMSPPPLCRYDVIDDQSALITLEYTEDDYTQGYTVTMLNSEDSIHIDMWGKNLILDKQ